MILGQLISANGITGRWLALGMEKLYVYCDTETELLSTIDIHFFLKVINFYLFASVGFIIFIPVNCIYSGQSHVKECDSSGSVVLPCQYHSAIALCLYIGLGLSCVR
jgi:hypothetical protein